MGLFPLFPSGNGTREREQAVSACPRANGAKRRSGRKPGARVTNSALAEFKVVAHGS